MTKNTTVLYVAFGANLAISGTDVVFSLKQALVELEQVGFVPLNVAKFWNTPCFPAGAGPDYVNTVMLYHDSLSRSPAEVLSIFHQVEAKFGRERITRWAGRTMDIDLLAWGDLVAPDVASYTLWQELPPEEQARLAPDQLVLPHPRIQDRAFVLVPFAEVAPDWRHPVLGCTVREMLAALPPGDVAEVVPL